MYICLCVCLYVYYYDAMCICASSCPTDIVKASLMLFSNKHSYILFESRTCLVANVDCERIATDVSVIQVNYYGHMLVVI